MENQLYFTTGVGQRKPNTINGRNIDCPFCKVEELDDIIAVQGSMILLKNKYATLRKTYQTVLIETDLCDSELSKYSKEHLYRLFRFAIDYWLKLHLNNQFRSVIMFKNHGPLSGGTISHPHLQIVGLEDVNYLLNYKREHFEGIVIKKCDFLEFNISTQPKIGFYEFNIRLSNLKVIDSMSDCIQIAIDYILNHFRYKCDSYNLFFYKIENEIYCKIIPRFVTSPLYIGYSIAQVADNIEDIANQIVNIYRKDLHN
ncbi:DUF4931 domain-containing protein [Fredinandcohnia humi]